MRPRCNAVILLCLLTLASGLAAAQSATVTLTNRPASAVLPLIRPLLAKGETASGDGFVVLLDAPEQRLRALEQALQALDRPLRRLLISVRQHHGGCRATGQTPPGKVLSTRKRPEDYELQQAITVDGQAVALWLGLDLPLPVVANGAGSLPGTALQGIEYRRLRRGFDLLPQVKGDQVWLEVSPRMERMVQQGRDRVDVKGGHFTVSGPLGQWLTVGRLCDSPADGDTSPSWRAGSAAQSWAIDIKAEEINDDGEH